MWVRELRQTPRPGRDREGAALAGVLSLTDVLRAVYQVTRREYDAELGEHATSDTASAGV